MSYNETRRGFLIRMVGTMGSLTPFLFYGCDNKDGSGPLGPSGGGVFRDTIRVSPPTVFVVSGGTQTFTATGGTGTFTWSVDNNALGTIDPSTGVFTAGSAAGTVIVTATDTNNSTGTATIAIGSGNPIIIIPSSITLSKGGSQTFSASGGTGSFFWSVSNTAMGSVNSSSGSFTAGGTAGSVAVVATDTTGLAASAAVTIVVPTITILPALITIANTVTVPYTQTYTASGGTSPYFYSMANSSSISTYVGASMNLTSGVLTITALPTLAETSQTFTITATDSYGDIGTTTVIIQAATA